MNPKLLYHGSSYLHEELKPGFYHTGKIVQWDQIENNKFLYASSVMKDAFEQAFAGWLERHFEITRFISDNDKITVHLKDGRVPTQMELKDLKVYVYTIVVHPEDWWIKNNNPHNNISTEWKTENIIPASHIECVHTYDTLALAKRVKFVPTGLKAGLEELYERELVFESPQFVAPSPYLYW